MQMANIRPMTGSGTRDRCFQIKEVGNLPARHEDIFRHFEAIERAQIHHPMDPPRASFTMQIAV
jgi:hypothetical protein